jgi:hypothetical protein
MVNLAERMTLLVVSPRARSSWFEHWGLPLRLIVTGLWVHEGSQLDLVVVRPNHLSKVPGGTGWGAFHPGLSATAARDLCKRLLGDPLAATLHQDRIVDLLYELHPESIPMNQIQTTRVDNAPAPVDKSVWHFTLRLQRERDLLLKQAAERDLLLKQAAEREQRAAAREQEVARERAEVERLERRLLLRLLIVQGKPLAELQDCSLAELRQMLPDED